MGFIFDNSRKVKKSPWCAVQRAGGSFCIDLCSHKQAARGCFALWCNYLLAFLFLRLCGLLGEHLCRLGIEVYRALKSLAERRAQWLRDSS